MMKPFSLLQFIEESNHIEGIDRLPYTEEVEAHERLLALTKVTVADLGEFVAVVQPGAKLRQMSGMNVRVGRHYPPRGGPEIRKRLEAILENRDHLDSFLQHMAYEILHPFMDGNGRSGRALWLHRMGGIEGAPLGFLHTFYYQTLDHSDRLGFYHD